MNLFRRFVLAFILVFSVSIFANEVTVTSRVDRTTLGQDEQLGFDLVISGKVDNGMQLHLPAFEGNFQVVSQGQESSYSIINGQVSSSQTRHFVLQPLRVGDVTIPAAKLVGNGVTYQSQPVLVHVKKGSANHAATQGGNNNDVVFLRGTVSKTEAYEGEEIVYQLEFLRRVQLWSSISYQLPEYKGFWVESLKSKTDEYSQQINGRGFGVKELVRRSLFPLQAGTATVSSTKAGFVLNPFEGDRLIESKPITIKVKVLPLTGKPADFSGLVGEFSLSANKAPAIASQNQPITLRLELKGRGGLTRVSDLVFTDDPSFKIYKSTIRDAIQFENGVSGKRVFDYILVPKSPGKFKTPSFSLSYFHVREARYKTLVVPGSELTVLPSSDSGDINDFHGESGSSGASLINQDIHYLHTDLDTGKMVVVKKILAWILGCLSGLLLVTLLGMSLVRQFVFKTDKDVQHSFASRDALKRLALLEKKKSKQPYSELESILMDYLSARTRVELNGLTQDRLQVVLVEKGVGADCIGSICHFLEAVQAAGYAPIGGEPRELSDYTAELKGILLTLKGVV